MSKEPISAWGKAITVAVLGVLVLMPVLGWPVYRVWQREMSGKAKLREAEWSRQIAVEEAKAHQESAEYQRQAEIIRARGVAEANEIIGESLKENEAYLRWRWIEGLQTNQMQVLYVPTEANLPILEAGRR